MLALVSLVIVEPGERCPKDVGGKADGEQVIRISEIEHLGTGHCGVERCGCGDKCAQGIGSRHGPAAHEPKVARGHPIPGEHCRNGSEPLEVLRSGDTPGVGVATDNDDLLRPVHLAAHGIESFGEAGVAAHQDGRDDRCRSCSH